MKANILIVYLFAFSYLYSLVEPSIAGTVLTTSAVKHLMRHIRLVSIVGQSVSFRADFTYGIEFRSECLQVEINEKQAPLDQCQIVAIRSTLHQQLSAMCPIISLLRRQNAHRIRTCGTSCLFGIHYDVQQFRSNLFFGQMCCVFARSQSQNVKLSIDKFK